MASDGLVGEVKASTLSPLCKLVIVAVVSCVVTGIVVGLSVGLPLSLLRTDDSKVNSHVSTVGTSTSTTKTSDEVTTSAAEDVTSVNTTSSTSSISENTTGSSVSQNQQTINSNVTTMATKMTGSTSNGFVTAQSTSESSGFPTSSSLISEQTVSTESRGRTSDSLSVETSSLGMPIGTGLTSSDTIKETGMTSTDSTTETSSRKSIETTDSKSMFSSQTSFPASKVSNSIITDQLTTTTPIYTMLTSSTGTSTQHTTETPILCSADLERTIVLMYVATNFGESVFFRGGSSTGAIRIEHPSLVLGNSTTFTSYYEWAVGDTTLDWGDRQPGQRSDAYGSPTAYTTDDNSDPSYYSNNRYGAGYWAMDICMNRSDTNNGWFQIKSYKHPGGGWEGAINQVNTCAGSAPSAVRSGAPSGTGNHLGQCGMINVFSRDQTSCTIDNLS